MRSESPFIWRLTAAAIITATGFAVHAWAIAGIGLATVALLVALRIWARRTPTIGSVATTFAAVGMGCVGLSVYAATRGGLSLDLLAVIALLPATLFLFFAWIVAFRATTGRPAPGLGALNLAVARGNQDARIRWRRAQPPKEDKTRSPDR